MQVNHNSILVLSPFFVWPQHNIFGKGWGKLVGVLEVAEAGRTMATAGCGPSSCRRVGDVVRAANSCKNHCSSVFLLCSSSSLLRLSSSCRWRSSSILHLASVLSMSGFLLSFLILLLTLSIQLLPLFCLLPPYFLHLQRYFHGCISWLWFWERRRWRRWRDFLLCSLFPSVWCSDNASARGYTV